MKIWIFSQGCRWGIIWGHQNIKKRIKFPHFFNKIRRNGIESEASLDATVSSMKKLFGYSSSIDSKDIDPKYTKEKDTSIQLKEKYQNTNQLS